MARLLLTRGIRSRMLDVCGLTRCVGNVEQRRPGIVVDRYYRDIDLEDESRASRCQVSKSLSSEHVCHG